MIDSLIGVNGVRNCRVYTFPSRPRVAPTERAELSGEGRFRQSYSRTGSVRYWPGYGERGDVRAACPEECYSPELGSELDVVA